LCEPWRLVGSCIFLAYGITWRQMISYRLWLSLSRTKSILHLLRRKLISFDWRVMFLKQNTALSNCLESQLQRLEYIWEAIKYVRKHFVFSSVFWHLTKCRCLLLLVSINFSSVQGCAIVSVRAGISGLILMGMTYREVTACHGEVTVCHGKTEKHIRGHKPCIVVDPGYLSRYSDSLRAGRSGDRIPVKAKFSFPVQSGPGFHPTLYTLGTGLFRGKAAGRWPPTLSSAEDKEKVVLYLYYPSGHSWPVSGWFVPLPLFAVTRVYNVSFWDRNKQLFRCPLCFLLQVKRKKCNVDFWAHWLNPLNTGGQKKKEKK